MYGHNITQLRPLFGWFTTARPYSQQSYRTHNCGELRTAHVGQKVKIAGWLQKPRKVSSREEIPLFIPIQDIYGVTQAVTKEPAIRSLILHTPFESVISVEGTVIQRVSPNTNIPTGAIEVEAETVNVLNSSSNLPCSPNSTGSRVARNSRHLFLRRKENLDVLSKRSQFTHFISHYLHTKHDFMEIETPILSKKSPEGAKEFIVPSSNLKKQFYVLSQSPQQFKQLLMVSSIDKYFQIAKCFRDEIHTTQRQIEFSQLDLEMAFVTQDDVMDLVEELVCRTVECIFPNRNISEKPFPRLTYEAAKEKYSTDKPDLRTSDTMDKLAFAWIQDFPLFKQTSEGGIKSVHHPFTTHHEDDGELVYTQPLQTRGQSFDLVLNGVEIGGGSIRIHQPALQKHIIESVLEQDSTDLQHLITALGHGCPPHGGFALGLDRILTILMVKSNANDVIAFPKSHAGRDNTIGSPRELTQLELSDYGLRYI